MYALFGTLVTFASVKVFNPCVVNVVLSICAFFATLKLIPSVKTMFLNAGLSGRDLNKVSGDVIPEALGVVSGCMFLITMFLLIPFSFVTSNGFPYHEFVELLAALLSICCMILLGFADDVLNLKWRYKLLLPTIASLPLLMVYYVNINSTIIIVPKPLRFFFNDQIDIGLLYYLYMGTLAVFCTNAINILAGINGLEVGQSLIIAVSVICFNVIESYGDNWRNHQFSLTLLMPFVTTSGALFVFNKYPSTVFVGDTFCYLAGMTFAVVGIIGHFSKTLLLFFLPQICNFLYSVPQLFRFVPCPRHRIPKLNRETGLMTASLVKCPKNEVSPVGYFILKSFSRLNIIYFKETEQDVIFNNLTLLNFCLIVRENCLNEEQLCHVLLTLQVIFSIFAFFVRYPLSTLFYD